MDKSAIISEIKKFLDGENEDIKYLVHIEANPNENVADCIIHPPGGDKEVVKIPFQCFMYTKDFVKEGITLFNGDKQLEKSMQIMYGIEIIDLETGGQKRLEDGYCKKITSSKSFNSIIEYFKKGGIYPYQKAEDEYGDVIKNEKGRPVYLHLHLFYSPKLFEQFLIDKKARLYKGFEEYDDVHRLIFDIETTGLRYEITRMFEIGVRDNRGFETILEVDTPNDDAAEIRLIQDFFNLVSILKPAIIAGYNSEEFDFPFILGRASLLKMDLNKLTTSLRADVKIKRRPNTSLKVGGDTFKFTATDMWGISIIDILHASRRTAAINSDIKETNLKYIAKFEELAKENRTYIPGEDNSIGRYYHDNPFFVANADNVHLEVPPQYQKTAERLFKLQNLDGSEGVENHKYLKNQILTEDPDFVEWFRHEALSQGMSTFIGGRELVRQYLLDDLWETHQVDETYNQSSFMLAKIVPTNYQRITTMGTASVWTLLLTAWSYERNLAIPHADVYKHFSGGLSRCYKRGFSKRFVKIDYASLYPMLQLTHDIFPIFDISGVMKKMLIYMTTTRNICKKLGKGSKLNEEETTLVHKIDHDADAKYRENRISKKDQSMYGIKQLPIKILNNSQFGALGAHVAFNWSDNDCAARITASGRIELRHAIAWFAQYGCIPLYAVTDGVNFFLPDNTKFKITNEGIIEGTTEGLIEEMWQYGGEVGINALIEYFNDQEMHKPFMAVDNDGEFISCYNLARINYAVLQEYEDKKTKELKTKVKYTGNSIKSSVMPEYVEDFYDKGFRMILEGKGPEFVDYYYDYAQEIYYKQIPLKKIASKKRYKNTLKQYHNRGLQKNGRPKAKQAHMELVIKQREIIAEKLFQEHKEKLEFKKDEEKLTIQDKMKLVELYMPQEPELDSTLFYYNTGYRKSHGDSGEIKDKDTGEMRFASTIINKQDMIDNPDLKGDYNVDKYIGAFNEKVKSMLHGFDPEIAGKILVKIVRKKVKDSEGNKVEEESLTMGHFTREELTLKSFDLDDVQESMNLEKHEVSFWNETGYDPRKVWDGFSMFEDDKVYYEIYEGALNYLNEKMIADGRKPIKSRNEPIYKNDLVLIKKGPKYSIGRHNGEYIAIVRSEVEIPKSEIELELDRVSAEKEQKLKDLEVNESKSAKEVELENKLQKRIKFYPAFQEAFPVVAETPFELFVESHGDDGIQMLDEFMVKTETEEKEEVRTYMGGDYE